LSTVVLIIDLLKSFDIITQVFFRDSRIAHQRYPGEIRFEQSEEAFVSFSALLEADQHLGSPFWGWWDKRDQRRDEERESSFQVYAVGCEDNVRALQKFRKRLGPVDWWR
jgi:hypothetical protein